MQATSESNTEAVGKQRSVVSTALDVMIDGVTAAGNVAESAANAVFQLETDVENESNTELKANIIFSTTNAVLFSALHARLGLTLEWTPWKPRLLELYSDGTVLCRKNGSLAIRGQYDVQYVAITELSTNTKIPQYQEGMDMKGIVVQCASKEGYETSFRCIFNGEEFHQFCDMIRRVSSQHNLDHMKRGSITSFLPSNQDTNTKSNDGDPVSSSGLQLIHPKALEKGGIVSDTATKIATRSPSAVQSSMRRALAAAMDSYDIRSTKERVKSHRAVFRFLPVLFFNDLVHGAWWFLVGSVAFVATSIVTMVNSYNHVLGDDDSLLPQYEYRITWWLMLLSGGLSTLGSAAFVRAVHSDPPLPPLFPDWYHIQSDELLGSWLFLLGALPIIPYSILYLIVAEDNYEAIGGLSVSLILVAGLSLLVKSSYPSAQPIEFKIAQQLSQFMFCGLCPKRWLLKHFATDWLAGLWIVLWATVVAAECNALIFAQVAAKGHWLQIFVYGSGLLTTLMFIVGTIYFIAGSYPESALLVDLESDEVINNYTDGAGDGAMDYSNHAPRNLQPHDHPYTELPATDGTTNLGYVDFHVHTNSTEISSPHAGDKSKKWNSSVTFGSNETTRKFSGKKYAKAPLLKEIIDRENENL